MYKVVIAPKEQGQKAIVYETDDRAVARAGVIVGKALGVETKVFVEAAVKEVKFSGFD